MINQEDNGCCSAHAFRLLELQRDANSSLNARGSEEDPQYRAAWALAEMLRGLCQGIGL
jgi:hypothetical protein